VVIKRRIVSIMEIFEPNVVLPASWRNVYIALTQVIEAVMAALATLENFLAVDGVVWVKES
jgi:hypothetical protein